MGSQGGFSTASLWEAIHSGSLGKSIVGWREYSQAFLLCLFGY